MKLLSETTNNSNVSNGLTKVQPLSPSTERRIRGLIGKYPTTGKFILAFHPDKIEHFASYPDRCLFGEAPTLTDLRLAYDGRADLQWLIVQLTTFQEKLNVSQKMTSYQLETLAQTIATEFHHLKASEICLFLARLQGGSYTVDWYGSVSPDKIVSALREQFMPWRNNQFYQKEKREEEQKREEALHSPNNVTWEEWLEMKKQNKENVINEDNPLNVKIEQL